MGKYTRIGTMDITGLSIYQRPAFFVYRIKCKFSEHYYIGYTQDIEERCSGHVGSIRALIENGPCNPLDFHRRIYKLIQSEYEKDKRKKLKNFIIGSLSVEVLAAVLEKEAAKELERYYISTNLSKIWCCNLVAY